MADVIKMIIPLLDDGFKMSDFTKENGFVDGYLQDINKPYLVNHTFLLFHGELDTPEKMKRHFKFIKMECFYNVRTLYIKNVAYLLYTFVNINRSIKTHIINGFTPSSKDDFMKIQFFWQLTDDFINSTIINKTQKSNTNLILPEEDYHISIGDELEDNSSLILPKIAI